MQKEFIFPFMNVISAFYGLLYYLFNAPAGDMVDGTIINIIEYNGK